MTTAIVLTSVFWIAYYNRPAASANPAGQAANEAGASVGQLKVPVQGVERADLADTFSQARAAGARHHDAIDILAPAGTPVVAAAPGRIEKLFASTDGGNTIYVRTEDRRWIHYYAHLQSYAAGLAEGQHVDAATPIGYVGSTGNADPLAPHLHFAVIRMEAGQAWHEGQAVNPFPLLTAP